MFLLQRRRVTTWASSARPAAAKASPARAAAATPQVRVVDEPAVCQRLGEGVYELPAMLPRAACARVVAEVSARVSNGSATDRGASLKTTDVYVRDLADAEDVYRARASADSRHGDQERGKAGSGPVSLFLGAGATVDLGGLVAGLVAQVAQPEQQRHEQHRGEDHGEGDADQGAFMPAFRGFEIGFGCRQNWPLNSE